MNEDDDNFLLCMAATLILASAFWGVVTLILISI